MRHRRILIRKSPWFDFFTASEHGNEVNGGFAAQEAAHYERCLEAVLGRRGQNLERKPESGKYSANSMRREGELEFTDCDLCGKMEKGAACGRMADIASETDGTSNAERRTSKEARSGRSEFRCASDANHSTLKVRRSLACVLTLEMASDVHEHHHPHPDLPPWRGKEFRATARIEGWKMTRERNDMARICTTGEHLRAVPREFAVGDHHTV
jgi:hypothetical protein